MNILPFILLGQYWQWTEPAEYHHACVRVTCQDRNETSAGSGIQIEYGKLKGVLTASHINYGKPSTVTFSDGTKQFAESTRDKFNHDIAFIFTHNPKLPYIKIARSSPQLNDKLELITFGGPAKDKLRNFQATVTHPLASNQTLTTFKGCVTQGDSGAGILNSNHELVSIQSIGINQPIARSDDHDIFSHGAGANLTCIVDFLNRVQARCYGGVCYPQYNQPEINFYPPSNSQPFQPQPQPSTPEPQTIEIDYNKISEIVFNRIKENLSLFKGDKGDKGERGEKGDSPLINTNNLPPIIVHFEGGETHEVRLGESLTIPKVKMQIEHQDGKVFSQEKPLGEPIRLKLVPQ